jgi:hypothetical protein
MKAMTRDEFFKPGSIQVNKLDIYEEELCGGVSGPASNVDITLIWDEVSLVGNVNSGKGRFIIIKTFHLYLKAIIIRPKKCLLNFIPG